MKTKLWDRNFTLVTLASIIGSAGGIAGGFALSFFVFDKTQSTFLAALLLVLQFIPGLFINIIVSPIMDRLPRKLVLVFGDTLNGIIYLLLGLYLIFFEFSYVAFLGVGLILSVVGSLDELAYNSIYPELIPKGAEQKGYSVSGMIYPVLKVLMLPLAAVLLDTIGAPMILIIQGICSFLAAVTENFITLNENNKKKVRGFGFKEWKEDVKEAALFLKEEKGLRSLFNYMAVTNGIALGYAPVMIAFFRTFPGMNATLYSFFSMFEFGGRTLGSTLQYKIEIPKKKKFSILFMVYQIYEIVDMILLWLPYKFMLASKFMTGFLGTNSAIIRESAVQVYIPNHLRSRINAYFSILLTLSGAILSLLVGLLGEFLDYRWTVTIAAGVTYISIWFFIWRNKGYIKKIFENEDRAIDNPVELQ